MLLRLSLLCFLVGLFPVCGRAVNRYVSTSGNNANAGTLAAPWRTVPVRRQHGQCG